MNPDALGGEDAAWLHMEEATNPMVVNGVLELASRLPIEDAHALFGRLAQKPPFRARVVAPPLRLGHPLWEPAPGFDFRDHVEHIEVAGGDDAAVRAFIGSAAGALLDPQRPLWRVYLIDRPGAGTTILCRVHHSIADGFALLDVLLSLCDDAPRPAGMPKSWRHARRRTGTIVRSAKALWRVVALPPDRKTFLKGRLGSSKKVAWSQPLALADVKATAHFAGATVNDVLVATATGALRRYLERRGENTDGLELHAMVPVNLRTEPPPPTLGNRFGLVVLGLPLGVGDPLARVSSVKRRMTTLERSAEPFVTHALLGAIGSAPRRVEQAAVSFFGTKASLVLTNVPGPRAQLRLAGIPISRIMFWVPQSARMGLGISIFSYAGAVTVGILSDAGLVPDPDVLVADFHAEYAELSALRAAVESAAPVVPPPPDSHVSLA